MRRKPTGNDQNKKKQNRRSHLYRSWMVWYIWYKNLWKILFVPRVCAQAEPNKPATLEEFPAIRNCGDLIFEFLESKTVRFVMVTKEKKFGEWVRKGGNRENVPSYSVLQRLWSIQVYVFGVFYIVLLTFPYRRVTFTTERYSHDKIFSKNQIPSSCDIKETHQQPATTHLCTVTQTTFKIVKNTFLSIDTSSHHPALFIDIITPTII